MGLASSTIYRNKGSVVSKRAGSVWYSHASLYRLPRFGLLRLEASYKSLISQRYSPGNKEIYAAFAGEWRDPKGWTILLMHHFLCALFRTFLSHKTVVTHPISSH